MAALDLLTLVNQLLFLGLFAAVAWRALREPSRATRDATVLFAALAAVILVGMLAGPLGFQGAWWLAGTVLLLINIVPWAMLRLVDDFSGTPRWVLPAGTLVLVGLGVLGFTTDFSNPLTELAVLSWFLIVGGYAAVAFARAAVSRWGITRWRMAGIATGATLFVGAIVLVLTAALVRGGSRDVLEVAVQLLAFGAATAFYLGFAPPRWLRRSWREPHLRRFFERSVELSGTADDARVTIELQDAVAATMGTPGATLAIASDDGTRLQYVRSDGTPVDHPADTFIAGRAFSRGERIVARDAAALDPEHADAYAAVEAVVVIAVPIQLGGRTLGSLCVYGDREPIFIEEDLWLLGLLADQIAMIVEARRTARVASELRGREESMQLKEEFLSAAAHDLRTPLTVILGQAELLERRLARNPEARVDSAGVSRMARESRRLRDLVSDLLDAQRIEEGQVSLERQPTDLRVIVQKALERHQDRVSFTAELGDEPIIGSVDRMRVEQVVDNLVQNAARYGAGGEAPELRAWAEAGEARLAVIDHGIGIPPDERAQIFDRFFRASNARARSDTGLGLGLYICRTIVEGHGGRIWAEETDGGGSTFHVALPLVEPPWVEPASPAAGGVAEFGTAEAVADA